jgi:mono/diheme cytochrome c family protein
VFKKITVLLLSLLLLNSATSWSHGVKKHRVRAGVWSVPVVMAQPINPLTDDGDTVEQGQALFVMYCAACHGTDGRGNTTTINLNRSSMDHSAGAWAYKVANGRGEMPRWNLILTDNNIWQLVA